MFNELFKKSGLSLDRLRTLAMLKRYGTLTKASGNSHIMQSQFSRQIKELEIFFATPLTIKKGRYAELTKNGEHLAKIAIDILSQLDYFRQECKTKKYTFTIGGDPAINQWVLEPIMEKIVQIRPDWSLQLENISNQEASDKLDSLELDMVIIGKKSLTSKSAKTKKIFVFDYSLYISKTLLKSLNIKKPRIDSSIPMAIWSENYLDEKLIEVYRQKGLKINIKTRLPSLTALARIVKSGVCAGILPNICENFLGDDFVKISNPIFDFMRNEFVIAWNPKIETTNSQFKELKSFILKSCKNI